jgi:hypothetical protein
MRQPRVRRAVGLTVAAAVGGSAAGTRTSVTQTRTRDRSLHSGRAVCEANTAAHVCTGTGARPLPHLHRDWGSHVPHLHRDCGPPLPHLHRDWGPPLPHLHRDWGSHVPHLHRDWGLPLPHLHRDWGPPLATSAPGLGLTGATSAPGLGPAPATSAPGLGSDRPDWSARACARPSPSRPRGCGTDPLGIAQRGARDGIPLTADPTYRRSHLPPIPLTADPTYRRSHLPPIPLTFL